MFLSMESTAFHPQLFVARPSLVLGWLKSQVLRQILQCHISPLRVGAKAAQSFQTTSLKTTAQRFKWFRQQTPAYVQRCVCVCVRASQRCALSSAFTFYWCADFYLSFLWICLWQEETHGTRLWESMQFNVSLMSHFVWLSDLRLEELGGKGMWPKGLSNDEVSVYEVQWHVARNSRDYNWLCSYSFGFFASVL